MRKLTQLSLMAISLLLLTGCNPKSLVSHKLNLKLPKLQSVKAVAGSTTVGFEWQPLSQKGLDGINIYRTEANAYAGDTTKQLSKIATISSPFSSHYVDKGLKQNSTYTYTFTTIKGGYESAHGKVIEIKTLPPLPAVSFFQGAQKSKSIVKLIWRPHPDQRIKMYKIQRSVSKENWKWIGTVNDRMMVEYLDGYARAGKQHQYRIIAVGFDGSLSRPSKVVSINAR